MGKYALLIGVEQYGEGLQSLPAATKDVAALGKVLDNPDLGGFDNVKQVINPTRAEMEQEIELWLRGREPSDLIVLFFSGHGIKDKQRRLYFAAKNTMKENGLLIRSTALPAINIQDYLGSCKAKSQVIILDCCFSGAFGNMIPRDTGEINLKDQLGVTEGQVVLTSTNAVGYSFEEKGSGLSIYTRYLVEGIDSGAADEDKDGVITVEELHRYAEHKTKEISSEMSPEIHRLKDEGFRICLARAPQHTPKMKYRKTAEQLAELGLEEDKFPLPARSILDRARSDLKLTNAETKAIEAEVLQPYQKYQARRQEYQNTLKECLKKKTNLDIQEIKRLKHLCKALD
ncbi:MAG: caspase family protein, partial [Cyanobacteria bacterium P01_B01_bin.77]